MPNSVSPIYTRPADLREFDYQAFEVSGMTNSGTINMLAAKGVNRAHSVHRLAVVVAVAETDATLTVQSAGGLVLVKLPLDVVGQYSFSWGDHPIGYVIEENATLDAVLVATAVDVTIQGYATH